MIVTVVGIGKLGGPMAALFAAAGHTVYCVDRNQEFLDAIRDKRAPVQEPGLQELIDQHGDRMFPVAVDQCAEAVSRSEFVFIIVPTPSTPQGDFSNEHILDALRPIGDAIRDGAHPHVVITCTTSPGACENVLIPALQQQTGKLAGLDFAVSYNPEFIALGSVIRDMRRPDFILIGSVQPRWADHLELFYLDLHYALSDPLPTVAKMNLVNAEITKLAVNCFCTMKISYANQLARLCEAIPGADAQVVADALGLDSRIGRKYLSPASIFGGPCLLPGTLVQTDSGLRRIDQIVIGDKVLSHDGRFHKVIETHAREYDGEIVTISCAGFPATPLTATPEHPVFASRRNTYNGKTHRVVSTTGQVKMSEMISREPTEFIPIGDLHIGDMLALPKIRPDVISPPVVRLKTHWTSSVLPRTEVDGDLMRVFGLYLAEGSTWKREIKFSFHQDEIDLVNDVAGVLTRTFGMKVEANTRPGTKCLNAELTCTSLAKYLRDAFGTHCWNKAPPPQWIALPEPMLQELIKGIWYGDGSDSTNRYTLGITSYELFNFMLLALLRLGIAFTTKHYPPRTGRDGVRHRAAYFVTVANAPYTEMMNDLLPRKKVSPRSGGKKTVWFDGDEMLFPIRKITRTHYSGPVCNLEVEGSNSYMLESSVVHNCFPRDGRAFQAAVRLTVAEVPLVEATQEINEQVVDHIVDLINRRNPTRLAILGLSYKPDTAVTEESLALKLIDHFSGHMECDIALHDPKARIQPDNTVLWDCARGAIHDADVVVIATAWPEYRDLEPDWFDSDPLILDLWNVLDAEAFRNHNRYVPGRGPACNA